jgi:hypothetical protein
MRRLSLSVGLAALTWLAIGSHIRAEERPFWMEGRGFVNPFGFSDQPYMVGSGEALHLGRAVWFSDLDATAIQQYDDVVPLNIRFHSSNGDVLYADIEADYDAESGVHLGTITFTGGTGRFTDATGSASLMILFSAPIVSYDYTHHVFLIEGTIDY